MEISRHQAEFLAVPGASIFSRLRVEQKKMRLVWDGVLSLRRDILTLTEPGRAPDEDRYAYLGRRAAQMEEINEVALGRYIVDNNLAPPEELQAIDDSFLQPFTDQEV